MCGYYTTPDEGDHARRTSPLGLFEGIPSGDEIGRRVEGLLTELVTDATASQEV